MLPKILLQNIQYYFDLFLLKKKYALLPCALVLALGACILFLSDRTYQADALIVMEVQQDSSSLISPTVSNERLQSIEQRVLARENLLSLAERFGLFKELRDTISDTQLAELIRKQITFVSMMSDPSTQFISNTSARIGFQYTDPNITADVVRYLVQTVIDDGKRIRVSRASDTVRFLVREVETLTERSREREKSWAQYISDNGDALPNRMPALLAEIQEKERELTQLDAGNSKTSEDLSLLEAQLRLGLKKGDTETRGRAQLATLDSEISERMLIYSDSHPIVHRLQQKREALRQQLARSPSTTVDVASLKGPDLTPELALIAEQIDIIKPRRDALLLQRQHLAERLSALKATAARAAEVESRLETIQVERESLQRSLDDMNAKVEAARRGERLEHDDSAVNIKVIEAPEVPRLPSGPRRAYLLVGVMAAAVAAGFMGLYVADILSTTIRGTFDMTEVLQGQTLLVVPRWYAAPVAELKPVGST